MRFFKRQTHKRHPVRASPQACFLSPPPQLPAETRSLFVIFFFTPSAAVLFHHHKYHNPHPPSIHPPSVLAFISLRLRLSLSPPTPHHTHQPNPLWSHLLSDGLSARVHGARTPAAAAALPRALRHSSTPSLRGAPQLCRLLLTMHFFLLSSFTFPSLNSNTSYLLSMCAPPHPARCSASVSSSSTRAVSR